MPSRFSRLDDAEALRRFVRDLHEGIYVTDETGRIMGLMPHPEAFVHRTNHPRWTREELPEEGDGLLLFKNAATYVREHLL